MFIPQSSQLQGLSLDKAQLFGMPCVGSHYTAEDYRRYALNENACCVICGEKATNSHHVVPKGVARSFLLKTPIGQFVLLSPLFALCGSGSTGCHDKFHKHILEARWEWYDDRLAERWWNGKIPAGCFPGSERLFELGRYVIYSNGEKLKEVAHG